MSKLKVTVNKSEAPVPTISHDSIPPGMVFKYKNGPIALKLTNDESVLLGYERCGNYSDLEPWMEITNGWKIMHIERILGKLTEVICEPV